MGSVYRATDRLTGQSIALKRVLAPTENLTFMTRSADADVHMALAREFHLLASLRHPNIISVLDYGFDEAQQPYFTLDLIDNAQTILDAGRTESLEGQVNLLVQILQALVYLHRRGILHRDLKPSNILVRAGQVKVLDFGMSVLREQVSQLKMDDSSVSGTLTHLAPEVLQGSPPSQASDLYSVGVIAYEILAQRHPFRVGNLDTLIHDIVFTAPVINDLPLDFSLKLILTRLLDKKPSSRYADASQVIRDLCEAIGQPPPPETLAIRESFLQAAQLVGRDKELANLSGVLAQAFEGQGSSWLVGGESGVGKSRLLDEVRILALVRGAIVLRGQGISDAGGPYHLWREALRWLSLLTDLSDEEASVLKVLVPDIETLLNRAVAEPPPLNAAATQRRLLGTLETLLRRHGKPTVIILEDLHWADAESLVVLQSLTEIAPSLSLLLLGSYRDDERPNLPGMVAGTQVLHLLRLTQEGIAALSESVLGEAGRNEAIVDLLQRQTEGNVFFLVEVMRTLAERAGNLEQIAAMTMPRHLLVGGIQEVVARRLKRVPASHFPLLQYAALVGRQLDLAVIRALAGDINLEQWLTDCAAAAVLDVEQERWRFAHDRLREGILADLPIYERRKLHAHVAEIMEPLYGNVVEQAEALAYHFTQSEHWAKAVQYLLAAGDNAARLYAYPDARRLYTQALDTLSLLPVTDDTRRQRVDTSIKYASVSFTAEDPAHNLGRLAEAETLAKALPGSDGKDGGDRWRLAWVHYWIGRSYYYRNQLREAAGYFQRVLAVAGEFGDKDLIAIPSGLIGRVLAVQGRYVQARSLFIQAIKGLENTEHHGDRFIALGFLGLIAAAHGEYAEGVAQIEQAEAEATKMQETLSALSTHVLLAFAHQWGNNYQAMLAVSQSLLDWGEQAGEQVYVYMGCASKAWAESYLGQHQAAAANAARARAITKQLGGQLVLADVFEAAYAEIAFNAGQMNEALAFAESAVAMAKAANNLLGEVNAIRVRARVLAEATPTDWEEVDSLFSSVVKAYETQQQNLELARTRMIWGHIYLRRNEASSARVQLEKAAAQFEQSNLLAELEQTRNWLSQWA